MTQRAQDTRVLRSESLRVRVDTNLWHRISMNVLQVSDIMLSKVSLSHMPKPKKLNMQAQQYNCMYHVTSSHSLVHSITSCMLIQFEWCTQPSVPQPGPCGTVITQDQEGMRYTCLFLPHFTVHVTVHTITQRMLIFNYNKNHTKASPPTCSSRTHHVLLTYCLESTISPCRLVSHPFKAGRFTGRIS